MPGSLLRSQFDALEEPAPDEGVVTVEARESVETEVTEIVAALGPAGGEQVET
jgi:gluconate kinase